jgi:type III pantothenate kinase
MILTIDIGNSNIVLGGVKDDQIVFEARLRTEATKTSDQYCVDLKILMEVYGVSNKDIEGTIIASVVPQVLNSMRTAIQKLTGKVPLVVGPGLKTGLNILLENPGQTGADLVVADVAALREHKPPLIVIDMGTATTISVVDKTGAFVGGMIMPGLRLSAEALSSRASQLPQISLKQPERAIGHNTVDCMRSGIILGTASILDGAIDRIQEELGYPCTVVSTGGNAKLVTPNCRHTIHTDEDLLLKGLQILYYKNK